MKKLDELFKKCKKYNVVSFDIFDTLLKRDVLVPTDVFSLVEKEYDSTRLEGKSNFSAKRHEAEKKARENSQYDEIMLDEIYDFIDFPEVDKSTLKRMELAMESAVLHYNPRILPIYKECVNTGKTVYIVSDMYLPKDFLESILLREGITGYKKLFLSCEYRKTKRSGLLFKAFCNEEKITARDIIHIGDSRYADYLSPRKVGIRSVHINRTNCNTLYMKKPLNNANVSERCLYAFINTRISEYDNRGFQIGYEILGPIIYAYCQWLHRRVLERHNGEYIWFAARDMYLFQKAFKYIYGEQNNEEYIYLSRKSLRPAYAKAAGSITKSGDVFARGKYSLKEIVEYLGYSMKDAVAESDIDIDNKKYDIRKLRQYPEIVRVLSSTSISKNEKELSELTIKYLREHGLFDHSIILADVGWHGTTQSILHEIQKNQSKNASIYGMYLGCLDGTREKIGKDNYEALIFDEEDESWFKKGILLFESLILAPHGSTKQYEIKENHIYPILSKGEPISPYILEVQHGALKFIEDYSKSTLSEQIDLDSKFIPKAFENMTCKPQKEELEAIGDLEYDNFYCNKMAAPKKFMHYLIHINELKIDLKYSPWRIGFLYRLFKIRLPYAKVYTFARKKQGKMT